MAQLHYYGKLVDIAGLKISTIPISENISTILGLIDELGKTNPALKKALNDAAVRFVVNEEIVANTHPISDGDEIAFLPPVSGG